MAQKKLFHLKKSDRRAKYWACWALCAHSNVCKKVEHAVWRQHQMELVDEVNHGTVWEHQRSYKKVTKTYRFLFETDEVILTIEGRIPEYRQHVVHPTMENRWQPIKAIVNSWMDQPVVVHFGEDRKVSHVEWAVA